MILNALDLITVTVPPALPTCLSIGISLALARMKKKQIYCISPPKVNISGQLTVLCFDKTGTLTEDGLDLYGVRPIIRATDKSQITGNYSKISSIDDYDYEGDIHFKPLI